MVIKKYQFNWSFHKNYACYTVVAQHYMQEKKIKINCDNDNPCGLRNEITITDAV